MHGKLAVLDLSENGRQIGEKLFILLNHRQQDELTDYILEREKRSFPRTLSAHTAPVISQPKDGSMPPLTEIQVEDLYFCLEERTVLVRNKKVDLTYREFEMLHLLIANRRRVITFEIISDYIWGYESGDDMTQAIHNIINRLRKKLKVEPDVPDYISSIRSVGYKFNM